MKPRSMPKHQRATNKSQQHKAKSPHSHNKIIKRTVTTRARNKQRATTTPNTSSLATHTQSLSPSPIPTLNTFTTTSTRRNNTNRNNSLITTSQRSMWFVPKPTSLKSKIQQTLINVFNLAPPPPSVNLEEFALMSKLFEVIIDCRTEEQRNEGKIPKSVHVPLSTMTEENRENMGIQFSRLTVLVYDQNGTIADTAASYLRDCGAEAWSLEGGADAFRDFVAQTRAGTYTRRVTLEEAQQHIYAQSRAGGRLPRKYDPNRVIEQFDPMLDESDSSDENVSNNNNNNNNGVKKHTISINPSEYNRQHQDDDGNDEKSPTQKKEEISQANKQQIDV